MNNVALGVILSAIIVFVFSSLRLPDISENGQKCLLFSLIAVVFWIFRITDVSFIAGAYLAVLIIVKCTLETGQEKFSKSSKLDRRNDLV